jgi:hypothetical protein
MDPTYNRPERPAPVIRLKMDRPDVNYYQHFSYPRVFGDAPGLRKWRDGETWVAFHVESLGY